MPNPDTEWPELRRAVLFMEGRSPDGASVKNDVGWNGTDAGFGRVLANATEWTPRMAFLAYGMLRKYAKTQLPAAGVDYDAIPAPPEPTQKRAENPRVVGTDATGALTFHFPYDPHVVDAVKTTFYGRRWNPEARLWTVPATRDNLFALAGFADAWGFALSPKVRASMDEAVAEPVPVKATLKPREMGYNENSREFTFSWDYHDPEFDAIKDAIKNGTWTRWARWDTTLRVWAVPASEHDAPAAKTFANEYCFAILESAQAFFDALATRDAALNARKELSKAADADFDVPTLQMKLMPFQRAGVKYVVDNEGGLIADQPGLGKTLQALGALEAKNAFPAIVVCPVNAIGAWIFHMKRALPHRTFSVVNGRTDFAADVLIVNYDKLKIQAWEEVRDETGAVVRDYDGKPKKQQVDLKPGDPRRALVDAIIARGNKGFVSDECHAIKTAKSLRTRATKEIASHVPFKVLLSGTPMMNRPSELVVPLEILKKLSEFGGYKEYTRRYCQGTWTGYGYDTKGASNLAELHEKLRAHVMVRRQKRDVLLELPEKTYSSVVVPLSDRAEYERVEADTFSWFAEKAVENAAFKASLEGLPDFEAARRREERRESAAFKAAQAEQLTRINALKQVAAKLKLPAVIDWVRDFLETGEKLVLFAHHIEIIEALASEFAGECVVVRGGVATEERQAVEKAFQENEKIRLFIGSIGAASVSFTLTAASDVAIVEFPWRPGDMEQAADRVHRIGQRDAVTVWSLAAEKTIDADIVELLHAKAQVLAAAVDGAEDPKSQSIVAELVERLRAKVGL